MSKKRFQSVCVVVIMAMLVGMAVPSASEAVKKLKVAGGKKSVVMMVGSVYSLTSNYKASTLTYKSSKANVVTVSQKGLLTAKKKGTAKITVKNSATSQKSVLKVKVKASKMYAISKSSGTYTDSVSIKLTAKSGYNVYYSTNGKLIKTNKVKGGTSTTLTYSKTTTLYLFPTKKSAKVTKANAVKYHYYITAGNEETETPTITPTETPAATEEPTAEPSTTSIPSTEPNMPSDPSIPGMPSMSPGPVTTPDPANDTTDNTLVSYVTPTAISVDEGDYDVSSTTITEDFTVSDTMTLNSSNASFSDGILTIKKAGTYRVSGTLTDGQIRLKADGEVHLILNQATINHNTGAAIYITKNKVVITLVGSNTLTQTAGTATTFATDEEEDAFEDDYGTATLFSKQPVTINGTGSLSIAGKIYNAVKVKDVLKLINTNVTVTEASNNGIVGSDGILMEGSNVSITSSGDGIKSGDDINGRVEINGGTIQVMSSEDMIDAEVTAVIAPDTMLLNSKDFSKASSNSDTSQKGIKAGSTVCVSAGSITINSIDDALHTNGTMRITGGTLNLATCDDGLHADYALRIEAGNITVSKSYEGLEAAQITISGGTSKITASDDGVNCAGGNDITTEDTDGYNTTVENKLIVTGGYLYVNAGGDGLDIGGGEPNSGDDDGSIYIYGGEVYVDGPESGANSALDYNEQTGKCEIDGGTLVAVGSAEMAQGPSASSQIPCVFVKFTAQQSGGTSVSLRDAQGKVYCTHTPSKKYQTAVLSNENLVLGGTYYIYLGETQYSAVTFTSTNMTIGTTDGGDRPTPPGPWR